MEEEGGGRSRARQVGSPSLCNSKKPRAERSDHFQRESIGRACSKKRGGKEIFAALKMIFAQREERSFGCEGEKPDMQQKKKKSGAPKGKKEAFKRQCCWAG